MYGNRADLKCDGIKLWVYKHSCASCFQISSIIQEEWVDLMLMPVRMACMPANCFAGRSDTGA